ncbi:hypothetical protein Ccrd_018605 [Cynara cardunculus var. scolymus]|uniref:Uncharacterized protein n=2 Tax=Cynara cardunculus var. scolymus TaxID=59895 RepID=A0A118K1M5_CYNCS|nr:hypothetical protein Ccrd_018605 [Cynara cardunculus var. scolymus]
MGIDPLTHKPLPLPTSSTEQQSPLLPSALVNEPSQTRENSPSKPMEYQNSESIEVVNETISIQSSSITEVAKDEQEDGEESTMIAKESQVGDFCTDEVPLIEPHEIMLPNDVNILPPLSSSSSSSSTSSNYNITICNQNYAHEEQHQFLPSFDWCSSSFDSTTYSNFEAGFWDDDDEFINSLSMLINDCDEIDTTTRNDATFTQDLTQCSRMLIDDDTWKFEQLL